eukprot:225130_1
MVLWYVTLGYFALHLFCLLIAYYQGNKSLQRRLNAKIIINHDRNTNNTTKHDTQRSSLSSIVHHGKHKQEEEENKYDENTNTDWKLSDVILSQQNSDNAIHSDLFKLYQMNQIDEFESHQTHISWPLFICVLHCVSMASSIGIIYDWISTLILAKDFTSTLDMELDIESLLIIKCITYSLCIVLLIYRIWSGYIIYKYTHSIYRFCVNLVIDYELIFSLYITAKVNKFHHGHIIIPLSHVHVFMSSVVSFWFILFLIIYVVLTQSFALLYIICIVFNYISMTTAFTMDDTARLVHGVDLQLICGYKITMSPSYMFRILFRHIDILFRLLIFYAVIISMGIIAFYGILFIECVWCILNGYVWSEFHYTLDVYHCLIASSLTLIHKADGDNNKTHDDLRRSATSYVCIQRVLCHFVLIILISCWMFISFECRYCPKYKNRSKHINIPLYILLWILLLLYSILGTFPVNVLNGNVSFKMLKINGADIETFKDSVFYGILIPNLKGTEFKIHPMQLYLFLTKQYDLEFIDLMLTQSNNAGGAHGIRLNNRDHWDDNMLHNICCNEGAPLSVIDMLSVKHKVSWNDFNQQNISPMHYYLQYNKQVAKAMIDLCITHCFTSIVTAYGADTLLHKLCKNPHVTKHIMQYVLSQSDFISLCLDVNVQKETPFHCYLKLNHHLSRTIIDQFIEIYTQKQEKPLTEYIDCWGNSLVHSICINPTLSVDILTYFVSLFPVQSVLSKNELKLKPIHYIEANHCYPQRLLQRLETMMNIAKSKAIEETAAIETTISTSKKRESKSGLFKIVVTTFDDEKHSGYSPIPRHTPTDDTFAYEKMEMKRIEEVEEDDEEEEKNIKQIKDIEIEIEETKQDTMIRVPPEKKRDKQLRLLKQIWFYDGRVTKPFGREELFFDFIECIDCVFNKFGQIAWYQIRGMITFRCDVSEHVLLHLLTNDLRNWRYSNMSIKKLQTERMSYVNLEYTSFHPCVNIHGWSKRRQIYLIPPNGVQLVLLSYRITSKYLESNIIPFRCYTSINYIESAHSVAFKIIFQNNMNASHPRYIAKLHIPFMDGTRRDIEHIITNNGSYEYSDDECIIWSIDNVSQFEPMMFEFTIHNISNKQILTDWLSRNRSNGTKPVINIEFKFISTYLFSKFNVEQYTAHDKNENIKVLRIWKRKQAMNGKCIVQLT